MEVQCCLNILLHPSSSSGLQSFELALVLLMLRDGWLFKRHTLQQWRHGSSEIKPTTLLYANNQIPMVLDEFALTGVERPTTHLICRDQHGHFRTSVAKEYPSNLCECFAQSIWRRISELCIRSTASSPEPYAVELAELAAMSASVDPSRTMQPDFQPYSR